MSKKKNNNLLYTIIFIIIALVAISYYFSTSKSDNNINKTESSSKSDTTKTEDTTKNKPDNSNDQGLNYYGKIYYIKNNDNNYQIFSKANSSDEQLLYTDNDEQEKIKFAKSMTNTAKFLALISEPNQTFGGSLYLINADGSGNKEKIIDNFISPQPPVISPDEAKIAYILFSNAETEYGFSLYIMNINGENKIKIDTDATMISNPVFDQNAKNIAYLKNNEIMSSDIDGTTKSSIYKLSTNETLNSINWDMEDEILLAINENSQKKSKIVSINTKNDDSKVIFESDANISDPIWLDTELSKIAYINTDSGKIELIDLNNNQITITEATGLIKWLK